MAETPTPTPHVRATRYEVSCLPDGHDDLGHFSITVEYRGRDRWAVLQRGRWCLSNTGEWDYEPTPSDRTGEWLAAHRFDRDTALRLAREQAPLIRVNGHTVADALARAVVGEA